MKVEIKAGTIFRSDSCSNKYYYVEMEPFMTDTCETLIGVREIKENGLDNKIMLIHVSEECYQCGPSWTPTSNAVRRYHNVYYVERVDASHSGKEYFTIVSTNVNWVRKNKLEILVQAMEKDLQTQLNNKKDAEAKIKALEDKIHEGKLKIEALKDNEHQQSDNKDS